METELIKGSGFTVFKPEIDFYIDRVVNNQFFSFAKLNHAYWQHLRKEEKWHEVISHLYDESFISEFQSTIKKIPKEDNFFLGVSTHGPPNKVFGRGLKSIEVMRETLASDINLHFGAIWKEYALKEIIYKWFEALNETKVYIVGLSHLSALKGKIPMNFSHYKIHIDAFRYREDIVKELNEIRMSSKEKVTFLFQCGDMLSTWLICQLHDLTDTFLVDMGRSLDFCIDVEFSKEDEERYKNLVESKGHVLYSTVQELIPDYKNQMWKMSRYRSNIMERKTRDISFL